MSLEVIGGQPRDLGEARKPAPGRPVVGAGNVGPVVMGPRPERVYSHSLLLELKEHPLARQWPPYLDPAFKNARGVWDPDRWHLDRKRGETPVGQEANGPDAPKDRKEARKEKAGGGGGGLTAGDGDDLAQLVLSPQRKSFLSGCNSGAGGNGGGEPEVSLRPEQPGAGNKRVGSGRLLSRPGHERGGDEDRGGFRRGEEFKRFPGDNRRDDKFGSGFRRGEDDGGWGGDRRDGGFFQHDDRRDGRRNMDDRRPQRRRNEPEWMSETISHNDIIELRGFDDKPNKKQTSGSLPLNVTLGIKNGPGKAPPPGMPTSGINVEDLEAGKPQKPRRKPSGPNDQNQNLIDSMKENVDSLNNIDILNDLGLVPKSGDDQINFDKIMESMLGGTSPVPQEYDQPKAPPQGKSRFSQFFNKGGASQGNDTAAPGAKHESRRSSIQDELLGANILKEINGEAPLVKIPSPNEEERYFAPISPAAQTRTNPILDMIQKSGPGPMPPQPPNNGQNRVQDLEENLRRQLGLAPGVPLPPLPPNPPQHILELLKQGHPQNGQLPPHHRQPPHHQQQHPQQQQAPSDMSAFKKLVAMVGQNPEGNNQGVPFGPGVVRPSPLPPHGSLPSNAPTEQEILDQMMSGQPRSKVTPPPHPPMPPMPGAHLPPPIASFLAAHPLNLELVARPEGKQLLVGLETGNITIDHLVAQVSNPALQQRQRDVLLSVLKLVTMQRPMGPPLMPGPPPGHEMLLPGQTPASRVSPLMFPPGTGAGATPGHLSISPAPQQARVPSPQEMTVLTQQIMQQALIKRKLEEQKENYRKKHGDQPMPVSASPLAFTPTSVMRKNAAERKDSDPAIKPVPELKITTQREGVKEDVLPPMPTSPGRAITKGHDDRPASLDLAAAAAGQQRRVSPQQMFPPQLPQSHPNPMMYLQNNPMGPVSQTMLSQANAMAQQQLAARMMAQGIDPMQFINRLPGQPPVPAPPLSPSRLPPASAPGMIPGMGPGPGQGAVSPGHQGQGPLARFFSPEVLAAAQSGAVPAMPPMPGSGQAPPKQDLPLMPGLPPIHSQHQKVLTLEEIERQAAAVRM